MVIGKKKRDVKFIIYQSLYILVIAMLGAKHVTINDIPDALKKGDIIIEKAKLDSLKNLTENKVILRKLENDSNYIIVNVNDIVVTKEYLDSIKNSKVIIKNIGSGPKPPNPPKPTKPGPGVVIPNQ